MRKVLIDAHTHTVASGHAYSSLHLILMMSILTDWILQLQVFMVTVGKVEQRRKIQKECSKSSVILKYILSAILEMEQQNWILNLWFWLQRSFIRFWRLTTTHWRPSARKPSQGTITWKYFAYAKNTMFLPFSVVTLISRSKLLTMTDSFRFWLKQISQTNLS